MSKFQAVIFTDMSSKIWHMRPLGAYRLASELRDHGYEVLVVDFFSKWLQDKRAFVNLLRRIITNDTLFVGYSATFFSTDNRIKREIISHREYFGLTARQHWPEPVEQIRLINRSIRQLSPQVRIFYGGAPASVIDHNLEESGVDYVIQGFADHLIVDILDRLTEGRSIPYALGAAKQVRVINRDPLGATFDFPASVTRFHASDCLESTEVLPLETSRGCLFKCKFCAFPLLGRKKSDPAYHKHVSGLTHELIRNYEQFGITKYTVIDDTFNETTDKLREVYQAIQDSGIRIEFSCYLRLDLVERYPEQIPLLYDMGLRSCFLGIETLHQPAARAIGKSSNIDKVKNTLEMARQVWGQDVAVFGSFIAGLPNETEDSLNQWMEWVYQREDLIDSYILSALNLTQRQQWPSEIGRDPEKFGYTVVGYQWINNQGMSSSQAEDLVNTWMGRSWREGRLRVAGWEMMGMQNLGYSARDLRAYTLDNLPIADFADRYIAQFQRYQQRLNTYLDQGERHADSRISCEQIA